MEQNLQTVLDLINADANLSEDEKAVIIARLNAVDKKMGVDAFRIERGEHLKKTMSVLLDETIEELEQKRQAVEEKNRDLEIEAALERVRTVAMGMRAANDLLSIGKILFEELTTLGFAELRNAMINIVNDEKGSFLNYDFNGSDSSVTQFSYGGHPVIDKQIEITRSASDAFIEHILTGNDLEDFKAFRVRNGEPTDPKLENIPALYYYFYSIGIGSLGISTFSALTNEKREILKRFRNVFDLAYRRYADIQLAEGQAKEARLETALERVRAVAMAMKKPEEVFGVCETTYNELIALGFTNLRNAQIVINKKETQSYIVFEYSDHSSTQMREAPIDSHPLIREISDEIEKSNDALFQKQVTGDEFEAWRKWRHKLDKGKDLRLDHVSSLCFYFYSIGAGALGISSYDPITNDQLDILKRFKKVFELSYTRYADVTQAETQAREAQIELALERVRARTMAMQHSEELAETAFILFQQFKELGENPDQATIGIINEEEHVIEYWVTMYGSQINKVFKFSIDEPNVTNKIYKSWKAHKKSLVIDLSGKALLDFTTYRASMGGAGFNPAEKRRVINVAFFSKGIINVQSTEARSEESVRLLERFAGVFDSTYTRFLDLKKAEAQVREAQIEAALERTRTQSMIMQHSSELDDTLRVFHQQVLLLGIRSAFSFLWLPDEEKDRHIFWAAWAENNSNDFKSKAINYPLDRNEPATAQCLIDWKGNDPVVSYHVPPEGVAGYFAAWQELIDGVEQLKPEYFKGGLYYVEAFMKYGGFGVMVENSLSQEESKILGRFAIEFERTYTRFLDLQKAEAQAREAQIELALERVRARTMAMQKSDELKEIIKVVYEQLVHLNILAEHAGFIMDYRANDDMRIWLTDKHFDPSYVTVPYFDSPHWNSFIEAKKKGNDFFAVYSTFEEKNKFYQDLFALVPGVTDESREYYLNCPGLAISTVLLDNIGLYIENFSGIPYTDEENSTLMRFGKVFQQTYTRFLDLQKAEAQAREAQIEAALEKVRSSSLAMHKSDELKDIVKVVFEKLQDLGFAIDGAAFIATPIENSRNLNIWIGDDHAEYPSCFRTPFYDSPVCLDIWAAMESGSDFFSATYSFEEKTPWFNYIFEHSDYKHLPGELKSWILGQETLTQCFAWTKNSAIGIHFHDRRLLSNNEIDILKRFAKVFDQAYIRFLDLQKAEAQAREAQIELSLERVRASAMAMHKTDQLLGAAELLYKELTGLGINSMAITYAIMAGDEKSAAYYSINPVDGKINPVPFDAPHTETEVMRSILSSWKKRETFSKLVLDEEATLRHQTYIAGILQAYFNEHNFDYNFSVEAFLAVSPKKAVIYAFNFSQGYIFIIGNEHLTKPQEEMVMRFAKVFEMTYRRFLDLKQAETQARQAQIEAAMEKVRSRSLAMQEPDELVEVAQVLRLEMALLGVEELETSSIYIHHEDSGKTECWYAIKDEHKLVSDHMDMNLGDTWVGRQMLKFYHSDKTQISIPMKGENRKEWINYCSTKSNLLDGFYGENIPERTYHLCKFSGGSMGAASPGDISAESWELLQRATTVFSFAYTRFSDLQQAEAQARESQIQLALERVRARTMAMQNSDELREVIQVVYDQLISLNFEIGNAGFAMDYKASDDFNLWIADSSVEIPTKVYIPYFDHPLFNRFIEAREKGLNFFTMSLTFDEKNKWVDHCSKHVAEVTQEIRETLFNCPGFVCSNILMKNVLLYIQNYSGSSYTDAENIALKRFGAVFEQTYTRFKDLEQAEGQAKESQIQLALERVRARTMAMQHSNELAETASLVSQQLHDLGLSFDRVGFYIWKKDANLVEGWTSNGTFDELLPPLVLPYLEDEGHRGIYEAAQRNEHSYEQVLGGEELKRHYEWLLSQPSVWGTLKTTGDNAFVPMPIQYKYAGIFKQGYLMLMAIEPQPGAANLLERFALVFEQTYTRFNDLKQAEEQAREAQVELSLERIRAKTMAMHTSEHVGETVATMFDELVKLGIEKTVRCGILIIDETKHMEVWTAAYDADGKVNMLIGRIDMMVHPLISNIHEAWKNKEQVRTYELAGKDLKAYYNAINDSPEYPFQLDLASLPAKQTNSAFFFPEGAIFAFTLDPLSEPEVKLFKRFAGVFGLTYRRFLDLQKAESQAKESQIQLALERVRARTMAMQKSEELAETSVEVFKQLIGLGIAPNRLFIGIIKDNSGDMELWATDEDGSKISTKFTGNINRNHSVKKMYDGWKTHKKSLTIDMKGKELQEYFRYLAEELKVPFKLGRSQKRRVQSIAYFSQGFIGMASPEPQPEETISLMERFAGVFNLTYTRFNDLQKAEAQAREAIKQASVDRVRGEIASMRSTTDLERITPLIWNELTILRIPFIRCGVFIIDDEERVIHTHLSTSDGKALATFNLQFDSEGIGQSVLPAWREKQAATIHWSKEEFADYTNNLVSQGTIKSRDKYVTEHPDTSLDLHFLPFLQGMLYVGNISPLTVDEMDLVQSLADAFSTAYARYEDFSKLEVAKQQVENTLTDLKAAQTKLIQSEKMASLGELTAGIAHEIQNPLNFVNNFSEVNQEMIDELAEELKAGNIEEALAIAADIKDNEQKINHHGKRADGIVKGMLQHSRTGGGEKQATNMNALADEFLRLSYHGLRAKDKSFNAELVTHFDPDLPKINVIGQDMGRVMLNLFNNAFYAVNQKMKTAAAGYKPEVSVSTATENGQVIIKVKDNGVGMPEHIKEKIMQPFFTTKPTGEGTGLGLSLTYDMVVKGHGGSINVDTKEGEYTEFTIMLPIS